MNDFYYAVQFEPGGETVAYDTVEQIFDLFKKKKIISILRYNDVKTGAAYSKEATAQDLSIEEQTQKPVFVITVLSDEGVFVESESFWIENYMLDEFYNPERMPYIEKVINHNNEDCC